jgi:hypothetical protein
MFLTQCLQNKWHAMHFFRIYISTFRVKIIKVFFKFLRKQRKLQNSVSFISICFRKSSFLMASFQKTCRWQWNFTSQFQCQNTSALNTSNCSVHICSSMRCPTVRKKIIPFSFPTISPTKNLRHFLAHFFLLLTKSRQLSPKQWIFYKAFAAKRNFGISIPYVYQKSTSSSRKHYFLSHSLFSIYWSTMKIQLIV